MGKTLGPPGDGQFLGPESILQVGLSCEEPGRCALDLSYYDSRLGSG